MKIPYDAECLAAVADELKKFVGGKVQDVRQPNGTDFVIALYQGVEAWFFVSIAPQFARAYFTTRRPANSPAPPTFCTALRARIGEARLIHVETLPGERILALDFSGPQGDHRLVIELMGKHSNAMLLEADEKLVSAMKWIDRRQSSRPIRPGGTYELPPVVGGTPQGSPFFRKLVAVGGGSGPYQPGYSEGHGAYPYSVEPLGLPFRPTESLSLALEKHYALEIPRAEAEAIRSSLVTALERVELARSVAIDGMDQAIEAGLHAGELQRRGELVLAYGPSILPGATEVEAWDFEGNPVQISIDPELGWKASAERLFERARKAKSRLGEVKDQRARLFGELVEIQSLLRRAREAAMVHELSDLRQEATKHRWLWVSQTPLRKDERPYEGHRIRELLAPGGFNVLYGENAEANDYLTMRVAKPQDIWLHVRGATSAHVVIQTQKHPEKVQKETLEFAARLAVRNSPSRHSGYVSVDFTLRRYVRKPRGAAKGTALYTHEKTLHVIAES